MGSGTDPMEGSSLSLAIINRLIQKRVRSVITTHLTPIKISAMENKNIENACVEFDVQTLMPTYRLIMGIPGNSNAIEISKRLGLDIDLIDEAKKRVGSKSIELQNIIGKLHNQSSFVEKQKRELQMKNDEVQELKSTLQRKIEKLKVKKYEEVSEEIYKLEKKLEDIVKEIEQNINLSKSDDRKEKVKALKNIQKLRKNITVENIESSPKIVSGKIDVGDHVKLIDGSSVGIVEKINGNDIWVKFGSMNLNIKREKLLKIEKAENKNDDKSQFISIPPSKISNNEIDIRGKISDEVPFIVEDFIEDLRRTGESEGFIIHGKGTGVLAQSVWRFLRRNQKIKSFRVGTPKEGGHGVTVIQL
jgi:DNA mismatch repair protein MutS2